MSRRVIGVLAAVAMVLAVAASGQLTPAPAAAAPPWPVNPAPIEPLAPYVPQTTCSPTVKPGTAALRSLVLAAYPGTYDLGIVRGCDVAGTSEHKEGRAWDWGLSAFNPTQDAQAKDFFAWLFATDDQGHTFAMARRLGIMYLIYNQHIWGSYDANAGWKPYSGSDPHTSHVHISLSWPGADRTSSYWVDIGPPRPAPPVGAFLTEWNSLGAAGGPLGAPTSGEYAVAGAQAQDFQRGRIYSSPDLGTHAVYGNIFLAYDRLGAQATLGLPVSDEGAVTGGRVSTFRSGRIFWSDATGAHAVVGLIGLHYDALGGPGGFLGLPTSDENAITGGRMSTFQGGRLLWSPNTGAQAVYGWIGLHYDALGGPGGFLGLPTSDETAIPSGRMSTFQGGRVLWSPTTGAQSVHGLIGLRYDALGGPGGALGLPTSDETAIPGGRWNTFQGGAILWSPATDARVVSGPALAYYTTHGGSAGFLGLPLGELTLVTGSLSVQVFMGGHIYQQGAQTLSVQGSIDVAYQATGGCLGSLGPPTSDEYDVPGGRRSDFQNGHLTWNATTWVITRT